MHSSCRIGWIRLEGLPWESSGEEKGLYASKSGIELPSVERKKEPLQLAEHDQMRKHNQDKTSTDVLQQENVEIAVLTPQEIRVGIGALAGGIAGGFTNVVLHPIDTVKTKLQTRGSSSLYTGPLDVIHKVLARQGIWGFYNGVQAALVGSVMSSAIYFGTYELAKSIFANIVTLPTTLTPPLAAALGNMTSSAILVPKEVVKQRMQAGLAGAAHEVFWHIFQSEGILGLYAGYSAALLRNLPSNIISFSTFEYLKMAWLKAGGASALAPWQSVVSGALAGALAAAVTTPFDVVKTRLMTQACSSLASPGMAAAVAEAVARAHFNAAYTYQGVSSTLQQICKDEGFNALLKGITPRVFYSACFSALGFSVFESVRTFLLLKYVEHRRKVAAYT